MLLPSLQARMMSSCAHSLLCASSLSDSPPHASLPRHSGLQFPHRLGGILAMSGYLPVAPKLVEKLPEMIHKENKETPILMRTARHSKRKGAGVL